MPFQIHSAHGHLRIKWKTFFFAVYLLEIWTVSYKCPFNGIWPSCYLFSCHQLSALVVITSYHSILGTCNYSDEKLLILPSAHLHIFRALQLKWTIFYFFLKKVDLLESRFFDHITHCSWNRPPRKMGENFIGPWGTLNFHLPLRGRWGV